MNRPVRAYSLCVDPAPVPAARTPPPRAAPRPRSDRHVRGLRLVSAGAAGLVLVSVGVTLASPGDELVACRSKLNGKPQVTVRSDRWVRIGAPKFDSGEGASTITAFSAMPTTKNGLLVTNGTVIKL